MWGRGFVHDEEFLRTHSTRVETPNPVAARFLSFHTGPAMSMCIHWTFSSTNCKQGRERQAVSTLLWKSSPKHSYLTNKNKNGSFGQSRHKGMSICYRATTHKVHATPMILSLYDQLSFRCQKQKCTCFRNSAAVIEPPCLPPVLTISATPDFIDSQ